MYYPHIFRPAGYICIPQKLDGMRHHENISTLSQKAQCLVGAKKVCPVANMWCLAHDTLCHLKSGKRYVCDVF